MLCSIVLKINFVDQSRVRKFEHGMTATTGITKYGFLIVSNICSTDHSAIMPPDFEGMLT